MKQLKFDKIAGPRSRQSFLMEPMELASNQQRKPKKMTTCNQLDLETLGF